MIQEANLHWRYMDTESNLVMPWYTLPTLKWLKTQDVKSWNVFEFGSGYSTIWWRLNCRKVISVDSNEAWAKAMSVTHWGDEKSFANALNTLGMWDCIVVDGIKREECVTECHHSLKPGGFLIIDNYDSEDYDPKPNEALLAPWARTIHKQPTHSIWQTAVFQKPA